MSNLGKTGKSEPTLSVSKILKIQCPLDLPLTKRTNLKNYEVLSCYKVYIVPCFTIKLTLYSTLERKSYRNPAEE